MGKLKEISSFKRYELSRELGKEGSNNYAIMIGNQKKFFKVVRSKKLADKIVAKLAIRGKDARVVLTAAPVTETYDSSRNKNRIMPPTIKVGLKVRLKKGDNKTHTIKKKLGPGKFQLDSGKTISAGDVGQIVKESKSEEAVYPHKMYDPKTGKAYTAKTPEDHERMTKLGYTHDDPNTPEKEEDVNEDILKEFKFPNVKKAILFFKKAFRKTTSIPKKISNKIKLYIDSLELEDVEDIYRADIPVVSGLAEIILYTKYNYTANQIQKIKQESVKVRKNKTGMMGSKTQVHKDKKKELSKTAARKKVSMDEKVEYLTLNQIKKNWAKEYPGTKFKFQVSKYKGAEILSVLSPKGNELESYNKVPGQGWTVREMKEEIEKDIEEGVDDPAIFKAIFLAGGPGSGKSFTVGKTGLGALGFRIVNSDEVFEFALKKAGLEATPKDIFSPKGQEIRGGAKKLTAKKMDLYLNGRLGLVIDGTGKDFNKIKKQATDLKKIGYDVGMIFVNTNLETAIARDAKRKRTLGADKVKVMWQEVQDNIGKFQNFFGGDFMVVDNSEGANWQKATLGAYKKASKFAKSPVRSPIAKKWIKDAGGRLKDSFSLDMQRKLAMVECITGDVDIQIAESITLDSKPSEIKELHKKLYGKNDKGRSEQT